MAGLADLAVSFGAEVIDAVGVEPEHPAIAELEAAIARLRAGYPRAAVAAMVDAHALMCRAMDIIANEDGLAVAFPDDFS